MKRLLLVLILCLPLRAADKDLGEQFRDALYIEEVDRNPAKAAESYEALLEAFDQQRSLAASTIFRLAEVRKGQDRKDEAVALYQRLLREFPEFERENKLARERLATLGAKADAPAKIGAPEEDADLLQLKEYQKLAATKPDILLKSSWLNQSVKGGLLRSTTYLIEEQGNQGDDRTLTTAVEEGSLPMTQLLLEKLKPSPKAAGYALEAAVSRSFPSVLKLLLENGMDPDSPVQAAQNRASSALLIAVENGNVEAAKILLEKGADPNRLFVPEGNSDSPGMMLKYGAALHVAALHSRLEIVDLLLSKGAEVNLPSAGGGYSPLHFAVLSQLKNGDDRVIQRLLNAGANPNAVASSGASEVVTASPFSDGRSRGTPLPFPGGQPIANLPSKATPLELALYNSCLPAAKALIKGGAKSSAERLTDAIRYVLLESEGESRAELVKILLQFGVKPSSKDVAIAAAEGDGKLMELILSKGLPNGCEDAFKQALGERSETVVRALLEAGVDPNALIKAPVYRDATGGASYRDYPPLCWALEGKRKGLFDLLIEKGADPNLRYSITKSGTESSVMYWDLVLRQKPDRESFQWLLDAGFEPGEELLLLIDEVAKIDTDGSLVAELLKRKPEGFVATQVPTMDGWADGVKKVYLEGTLYPAVQNPESIQMIDLGSGELDLLEKKDGNQETSPLARLLLDQHRLGQIPSGNSTYFQREIWIVRKVPSGDWQTKEMKLDELAKLPALEWGDLVVLPPLGNEGKEMREEDFVAVMRQNLEFPITLTMDGKTRPITMSGRRLFFNPVSDIVPIWNAKQFAMQMWQPANPWEKSAIASPIVEIERKGWGRIPLTGSSGASKFEFQAGDHVFISTPRDEKDAKGYSEEDILGLRDKRREQAVLVVIPGTPIVRTFADYSRRSDSDEVINPVTIPTLTQAIAATFAPEFKFLDDERDWNGIARRILRGELDASVLPPRPDFSSIVIRRMKPDGSEERIEVDLLGKMKLVTSNTTPEKARELDVALLTGDLVELHLPEGAAEPWNGFNKIEQLFMEKIHSGVITVQPDREAPMKASLIWAPATWMEVDGQRLPMKPKLRDSSARASDVSSIPWKDRTDDIIVLRDGTENRRASLYTLFLRDGDTISGATTSSSRRRVPAIPGRVPPTPGRSR